ncbi:MAG: exonuclease subunit SbcD [Dehalococcoidia bacterium]
MRVLHLSDVHIGVENYGRPATEADIAALPEYFAPGVERGQYVGMSTRMLDFLATLDQAVDHALRNDVDLVLFAGDAYKSRDPSQTHQREFARRIARLADAGVTVFLTVGNHDLPHVANRATALEIFPTLSVANVTVGATLETYRVETRAGAAQVVALPWIRISLFMARDETRGLTLEQIKEAIEGRLTEHLQEEAEKLDPALPSFLCGHVTVAGATVASERSMMLGNDHTLGLSTLANPAFDYVALGHIHKAQVLTQHPPVVYPGSLQRIDFSEEAHDKGFYVVDVDGSKERGERIAEMTFVPVSARPMLTISAQTRPGADPTETAVGEIGKHATELDQAIVRLRVSMDAEQEPAFNETTVRQALSPAHHIAGIERQVRRDRRTRLGSDDAERLGPMEALQRYFESRNMPEERERTLTAHAERLLREELEGAE